MTNDFQKATKKMEARIRKKAPTLTLVTPGLSIKVATSKGPVVDSELAKCQEFGKRFAAHLRK